jgi:acyl-CoA synthetase (AMP-forming)/AMP-acid ligase II
MLERGVENLGQLLDKRARQFPNARFGVAGDFGTLSDCYQLAAAGAVSLLRSGIKPGACAAVIGDTSFSYLLTWMALQLAGIQAALLNPSYPVELLRPMVDDLRADAVVWIGKSPDPTVGPHLPHYDATRLSSKGLAKTGQGELRLEAAAEELPGMSKGSTDIAGYAHTSGTTGRPKFCALSHEYFLRLGRFIADTHGMSPADTVFAPMPMFHVNPLGYGVVGGLTAGASVLGWTKFSARNFWKTVIGNEASVLILHLPPVEILKKSTTKEEAAGHKVRVTFCGESGFLEQFDIPRGVTCYGSTEGGGASHLWNVRAGDQMVELTEGIIRYGGRCRYDVERMLSAEGEILLREKEGNALFSGYRRRGTLEPCVDEDGWFHTGDLGRLDKWGNLVFVERMSESIRVKGEYVPIEFVETRLRAVFGIDDFAIWRRTAELGGDEVVIYTSSTSAPRDAILTATQDLPAFMRPVAIIVVPEIPRDTGVGKVQRRLLSTAPHSAVIALC